MKATGELGISNQLLSPKFDNTDHANAEEEVEPVQEIILEGSDGAKGIDYQSYRPKIVDDEWILSETDLCEYVETREDL